MDQHLEVGDLYMEYRKGECAKRETLCDYCSRCLRGIQVEITPARRAERASNLTFSKCLHLVDLNNPRILMTHDKMAVTANIRA